MGIYYANSLHTYFTRREALERIKEVIEDGFDGCYCDLHNTCFNEDYYIIGRYEAEHALEEYNPFTAIGAVFSYERSNFGEVYTDCSDPEKVANMLWYIVGEEAIQELDSVTGDRWNEYADEEGNAAVLEELEELLNEC